jgi:hypothetical protein
MLRLLCLVACFLFVKDVVADTKYIRVTGESYTIEQAKENAFRTAVQQRVGAIVLSERQATLGKLIKDDISLFSAGYVDDYKIIDITQNGSTFKITMDVLVADSKLFNQTLSRGKTSQGVDGEKTLTALSTFIEQKEKGDRMLEMVLSTYPQNAYIVSQQPYTLTVDSYRNTVFVVPYSLKWNYDFIVAMNEAMTLLENKVDFIGFMNLAPGNVIIMAKDPKNLIFGSKNVYKFNDIITLNKIKNSIGSREPRLRLLMTDNSNNILYETCYMPDSLSGRKASFYGIGEPKVFTIHGNEKESGVLTFVIKPEHNYIIQRANKVEVQIATDSQCPPY